MTTYPLYRITYPAGYYALTNVETGRTTRTGYDTCDESEEFIREKYKRALSRTVKVDSLGRKTISK